MSVGDAATSLNSMSTPLERLTEVEPELELELPEDEEDDEEEEEEEEEEAAFFLLLFFFAASAVAAVSSRTAQASATTSARRARIDAARELVRVLVRTVP